MHIDEYVFPLIVDELYLGSLVCGIDIFRVITAEFEVDETHESIGCCDDKDATEDKFMLVVTSGKRGRHDSLWQNQLRRGRELYSCCSLSWCFLHVITASPRY
jgi:hypothetical protein